MIQDIFGEVRPTLINKKPVKTRFQITKRSIFANTACHGPDIRMNAFNEVTVISFGT